MQFGNRGVSGKRHLGSDHVTEIKSVGLRRGTPRTERRALRLTDNITDVETPASNHFEVEPSRL